MEIYCSSPDVEKIEWLFEEMYIVFLGSECGEFPALFSSQKISEKQDPAPPKK